MTERQRARYDGVGVGGDDKNNNNNKKKLNNLLN